MPMHTPPSWRVHPRGLSGALRDQRTHLGREPRRRPLHARPGRNGKSGISPEMALRLAKALGRSPESWLAMQDHYDLWRARQHIDLGNVHHVNLASA